MFFKGNQALKLYHIAYEPSYGSVDFHFWTKCPLDCQACYTNFELYDFSLTDDIVAEIMDKPRTTPPTKFLSFDETLEKIKDLKIKYAVFMGTEAALDPELPKLCKALHEQFGAYNILLTNGYHLTDMADIDEIIFSLKAVTDEVYKKYTGRSNKPVLENLRKVVALGKNLHVEVVLIPDLIDGDEIEKCAKFVGEIDKNITFRIDAYFPVPGCPWRAAEKDEVEAAAVKARKFLNNVTVLTLDMKRIGDKALRIV